MLNRNIEKEINKLSRKQVILNLNAGFERYLKSLSETVLGSHLLPFIYILA